MVAPTTHPYPTNEKKRCNVTNNQRVVRKQDAQDTSNGWHSEFVGCELLASEKKQCEEWIKSTAWETLEDEVRGLLSEGLTLKISERDGSICASLTSRNGDERTTGKTLSGWHDEWSLAIYVVIYKHLHILEKDWRKHKVGVGGGMR